MAGLVEEIQVAALDRTVPVTDLLRKVKLAAAKLRLEEPADWVDKELGGYIGVHDNDLPPYRRGHGTLMNHTPFGRRALHGDTAMVAALSQVFIHEPISSLESLASSEGTDCIKGLDAEIEDAIKRTMGLSNCSLNVKFGKNLIVSAIDRVRDLVLEWSINLERQGILGEGISFTVEEKAKAAQAGQSINIQHFTGHLHQGDVSGHQNRTVVASTDNSTSSLDIESTFQKLLQRVEGGVTDEAHRKDLVDIIKNLQASQGTMDYTPWFQKLVGYAAEYTTVLGPFLPVLAQWVS